jgi:hypothetical protein
MDNGILVAVKDDRWDDPSCSTFNCRPAAHRVEGRREIPGRSCGKTLAANAIFAKAIHLFRIFPSISAETYKSGRGVEIGAK